MAKRTLLMTACALSVTAVVVAAGLGAATEERAYHYPRIEKYGKVVCLPEAVEQPRAGSRICVDVTTDGPVEAINPGVMKLARFVNIYAGAGSKPADVQITVVLHGKATTVVLTDEAYARRMGTTGNPNLPLLRGLKKSGVELIVCGQSAAGLEIKEDDIAPEVLTAVSALTANVNRQLAGYAYIPLH